MATLRNNNGIALVTALLFTLISLGIVMALLSIVTRGTKVSSASKTYRTAIEAGYGGVDVVVRDILPAIMNGTFDDLYKPSLTNKQSLTNALGMTFPDDTCFNKKVGFSTADWGADCPVAPTTQLPKESPDLTFTLKSTASDAGFNVFTKIVDTRCGGDTSAGQPCTNSDSSGVDYLDAGGGVTASSGSVTPQHRPAIYRIEVQSERAVNPQEKTQMSVLYAY